MTPDTQRHCRAARYRSLGRKKLESFGVTHKRGKKARDERALDD